MTLKIDIFRTLRCCCLVDMLLILCLIGLLHSATETEAFSPQKGHNQSRAKELNGLRVFGSPNDLPENSTEEQKSRLGLQRREVLSKIPSLLILGSQKCFADDGSSASTVDLSPVDVAPPGDVRQLFNEGRVYESQGNLAAANRIYTKVTRLAPRFIYGWSNLGNTQVAFGALEPAEESYTKAVDLCIENRKEEQKFGVRRCDDLYLLLLNRGSLRLNNNMAKEALKDLETADELRGKPDALILQNRARARELNGFFSGADRDYTVAISMTSNEVSPFWLRSAMVKFQIGDTIGAFDLIRRVENRFPEAPEVRAALATMLAAKGDQIGAQRKYLEIPDKARMKFVDENYVTKVISWPPKMIETLSVVSKAVGDKSAE